MDGNTKAIAEALRRWHEAPPPPDNVVEFSVARGLEARRKRESRDWLRRYTVPMPPDGDVA